MIFRELQEETGDQVAVEHQECKANVEPLASLAQKAPRGLVEHQGKQEDLELKATR